MMKYLLDEIKGCVGAWGITRLRRDFVGGPIRLRRASDNAEIDVPGCGKGICSSTIGKHLSVTVTNLFGTDGNFQSDSNTDGLGDGWTAVNVGTKSMANNTQMFTPSAQYGRIVKTTEVRNQSVGDIMYLCAYIKSASNQTILTLYNGSADVLKAHTGSNQFEFLSCRGTLANISTPYTSITSTAASGWTEISVQNAKVINLTKVFGAGNEPATAYMDSLVQSGNFEGVANGYITMLRDVSGPKYVKLVNALSTYGSFENDLIGWTKAVAQKATITSNSYEGSKAVLLVGDTAQIDAVYRDIAGSIGDKFYCCCYSKKVMGTAISMYISDMWSFSNAVFSSIPTEEFTFLSTMKTATTQGARVVLKADVSSSQIYDMVIAINLTATFGVGGEPTQTQMNSMVQRALREGYFTEKNVVRPTDAITVATSNQPRWNTGIKYDGMDDYFVVPNYPEIDILKPPMSISITLTPGENNIGYILAKNLDSADNMQYGVYTTADLCGLYVQGVQFSIVGVPAGVKTTIIFVIIGDKLYIYKDGVLRSKFSGLQTTYTSRPNFFIGKRAPNNAIFNNIIDSIMIFNRALTEREIKKITDYFL